jgi:hypothetical protein
MQQRRALDQSASGKAPKRTNRDIIRGIESSFCNDNVQQESVSEEVQQLEEEQELQPSEVTFTIFEDESETVSKSNGGAAGGHRAAAAGNLLQIINRISPQFKNPIQAVAAYVSYDFQ